MGRRSRFGLVDVFFAGGPNGRGKLFVRVCSRGLAPAEHCSCLRGLATQWEGAVTKLGKEQYSLSATPPGLLRETYSDHCDGPHSSSPL